MTVLLIVRKIIVPTLNSKTTDPWYGFKKGVGCTSAIYNMRMSIDHYINCGSTVNLCAVNLYIYIRYL